MGQWCEEYVDKLKDKSLRVCEYHGSKRKKYSKQPHLLSEFDLVVTTYETSSSNLISHAYGTPWKTSNTSYTTPKIIKKGLVASSYCPAFIEILPSNDNKDNRLRRSKRKRQQTQEHVKSFES